MTDAAAGAGRNRAPGAEVTCMDVRLTAYAFGHLSARTAPANPAARALRPARGTGARRRSEIPAALRRRRAGADLGPDPSRLASGGGQPVHY